MNNIGIGIMCFYEQKYFIQTNIKLDKILSQQVHCYILTDKPSYFYAFHGHNDYLHLIDYQRGIKSYHDKIILHKKILENHKTSIVIDADVEINDFSFIQDLKTYDFKNGISYIETLERHRWNKKMISDIDMSNIRWDLYNEYLKNKLLEIKDLETIWEYFIVFNKHVSDEFYNEYDKLQIVKEYCDLTSNMVKIYGAGEGITTKVASKITNTQCEKDSVLYDIISNKIKPVLSLK